MAFFDKLNDFANKATDKVGGAFTGSGTGVGKLNARITAEQNAIPGIFSQIGEYCYNKYVDTGGCDEGIAELCAQVDARRTAIDEAKAEIDRIKAEYAASATPGYNPAQAGYNPAQTGYNPAQAGYNPDPPAYNPAGYSPAAPAVGGTFCPSCGKQNQPDMKFCMECGAKLEAEKRICVCGAEVEPGVRFCSECGAKYE